MLRFFGKKNPPSQSPAEHCYIDKTGFNQYKVECNRSEDDYRVAEVVDKLLQAMAEMKVTNQTAMKIPAALHAAIEESFEWCVISSFYKPLAHDRSDCSSGGDD